MLWSHWAKSEPVCLCCFHLKAVHVGTVLKRVGHVSIPNKGLLCGQTASKQNGIPSALYWSHEPCLKNTLVYDAEEETEQLDCHEMDCCSAFLFKAIRRLGRREMSETSELWQIKLVLEFFSSRSHQERLQNHPKRGLFMNSEFLPVVKCTIDNTLDQWLQGNNSFVPLMLLRYTGTQAFLF